MTTDPEVFTQYLAALLANIGSIGVGCIMGYASPAGAALTANNTVEDDIFLTHSENSWFSSLPNLGAAFGCILSGFLLRYLGRRGTILYSSLFATLGWIILISAPNFLMLVTGRIITGLYCGIHIVAVSTLVGEYSSFHVRGTLGTFVQIFIFSGILLTYTLGAIFSGYRYNGAICAVLPCLCSISMIFVKESPLYLITKGKQLEAEESLRFYRGKNFSGITKELKTFQDSVEESNKKKATLKDLFKTQNLKPLTVVIVLMIFQQTSGFIAVISNLSLIFQKTGSTMSPNMSSISVGIVNVFSSSICSFFVEKAGRKLLLLISAITLTLSLSVMGIFFYLAEYYASVALSMTWVPLLAVMIYMIGFTAGFGVIPWVLLGEVFSPEVKETASSISSCIVWSCAFIFSLSFQSLEDLLHPFGVYWMFAALCLLSAFYTITSVYETKGKTLQEINDYYSGIQRRSEEIITLNSEMKDNA